MMESGWHRGDIDNNEGDFYDKKTKRKEKVSLWHVSKFQYWKNRFHYDSRGGEADIDDDDEDVDYDDDDDEQHNSDFR